MQRAGAEGQLEAVVLGRIVRAGDLDSADDGEVVERPVVERRRHDADVHDVDAGAGEPVDQRVAQTRRRSAGCRGRRRSRRAPRARRGTPRTRRRARAPPRASGRGRRRRGCRTAERSRRRWPCDRSKATNGPRAAAARPRRARRSTRRLSAASHGGRAASSPTAGRRRRAAHAGRPTLRESRRLLGHDAEARISRDARPSTTRVSPPDGSGAGALPARGRMNITITTYM